jgi:hypothetical protein
MITEDQLEQLAIQCFQDTGGENIEHRTPNTEHRSEEKRRLPEGVAAEREDRGNIEHRTLNIERRSEEKRSLAEEVTKSEHMMCRPFRAWNSMDDGTQGDALGYRMMPCWGGRRITP